MPAQHPNNCLQAVGRLRSIKRLMVKEKESLA
jgi:hypothetical protein